ncbi:MAG: hypothetical protein WCI89_00505 [bacterium]
MAGGEDKPAPMNPWEPVLLLVGALIIGTVLIWQRGGFSGVRSAGSVLINPPQTNTIEPNTQTTPTDASSTQTTQPTP